MEAIRKAWVLVLFALSIPLILLLALILFLGTGSMYQVKSFLSEFF